MRVKYIVCSDLEEMEATVNLYISEGWERDGILTQLGNGEWYMPLCKYEPNHEHNQLTPWGSGPLNSDISSREGAANDRG